MSEVESARKHELETRLAQVQERIAAACRACGREDLPTLIAVTKFFPVEDLVTLVALGAREVGENREQELASKVEYLQQEEPSVRASTTIHFIGQLQSKKAKKVAMLADVVQSLDRPKLIPPLAAGAHERGRVLKVLLQVDLEEHSSGRGGAQPQELDALAEAVAQQPMLQLAGLMAVAPLGEPPQRAFERLGSIRHEFLGRHPEATMLSAGMSGDLEEAVAIGATHLRVGSAILGSRPSDG